jgi:hypothetical protein
MVKAVDLMKGGKGMNEKYFVKGDMVAMDNSLFFINNKDINVSSHFFWAICLI